MQVIIKYLKIYRYRCIKIDIAVYKNRPVNRDYLEQIRKFNRKITKRLEQAFLQKD